MGQKERQQKGFTLVELLITIAILALLAAVVIPSVTGMYERGREEALSTEAAIIQTAVTLFNWDTHKGVLDGSWGQGPAGHHYPTDDGHCGTLTQANFPLPVGETQPESALDGIIWMGLLANTPGDVYGDSPATVRPQIGEDGPYLGEIPKSASTYNGRESSSGPYTWIILNDGTVAAVEIVGDIYTLTDVGPSPEPPLPPPPIDRACTLTVSSTTGGSVQLPGEGTFTYAEGTQVNLGAYCRGCNEFVNWTGDVDTVADAYDTDTTITMYGDYSITANFTRGEFARINIEIAPENQSWIYLEDESTGEWAIDKDGIPVDGSNHQSPTSIWVPLGDYVLEVQREGWTFQVDLPPLSPAVCEVTIKIER